MEQTKRTVNRKTKREKWITGHLAEIWSILLLIIIALEIVAICLQGCTIERSVNRSTTDSTHIKIK